MIDKSLIENTRCLIDFDGTIANSLPYYNRAIDRMFLGTVARRPYAEYYRDFGDAYEIIPGSPWRNIIMLLCAYLAREHEHIESFTTPAEGSLIKTSIMNTYDMSLTDVVLKVAYGVWLSGRVPGTDLCIYENDDMVISVVMGEIALAGHMSATEDVARKKGEHAEWLVLVPSGIAAWSQDDRARYESHVIYEQDIADKLEQVFEDLAVEEMGRLSYSDLAIEPVVQFCREYRNAGGSLVVQSGSNRRIVDKMMSVLGITDLFDAVFCTNTSLPPSDDPLAAAKAADAEAAGIRLESESEAENPWAYKTRLIEEIREWEDSLGDDCDKNRHDFIIGDTKGDAFGAYECGLPFLLCWRGYPADPESLSGNGETISPDAWIDATDGALAAQDIAAVAREVGTLIEFAERVGTEK